MAMLWANIETWKPVSPSSIHSCPYLLIEKSRSVDGFPFDTLDQPAYLWEDEEVAAVKRLIEERSKDFPTWSRYIELNEAQKEAVREMMATIAARKSRLERSWRR